MAIPHLSQLAVDTIRGGGDTGAVVAKVTRYAALIVLYGILQGFVRTLSRALIFNTGRDIEYELRNDLFRHLREAARSPIYQQQRTGDLMSRLINDIGAIRMMLGPGLLTFVNTPLYCVYAFTLMMLMDWRLTIAALVPFPILLWAVKHYSRAMMEATMQDAGASRRHVGLRAGDALRHPRRQGLRARRRPRAALRRHERALQDAEHGGRASCAAKIFPSIRIVSSLGILVVLYYGGCRSRRGRLTLGALVAFIGYLHILAWPIMALGWMISIWQRGKAAHGRASARSSTPSPTIAQSRSHRVVPADGPRRHALRRRRFLP